MDKIIKIGIIGISKGNGHPYSFSAIINGCDIEAMKDAWLNIYKYIKNRAIVDFGIPPAKVTHIWTQDLNESKKISKVSFIENIEENYLDMIDKIDAVIIARDDHIVHRELAELFLKAGKFVFIDKPLSLNINDLIFFKPYLEKAQLMSCSSIRYAPELDELKNTIYGFGDIKLIRGVTAKNWETYAIHLLDGIFSIVDFNIDSVYSHPIKQTSINLYTSSGNLIQIDALDEAITPIKFDFFGSKSYTNIDISDTFNSFKRTLQYFITMIQSGIQPINPELTINLMKVLIAQKISKDENRVVKLKEIKI